MTDISFFQRYSGPENHGTNNTMLMLRYVYQHSPIRFERLMASIVGSENAPVIGPRFAQQERIGTAIPDAVIEQEAFRVYVEAKPKGVPIDPRQIANHVEQIGAKHPGGSAVLIGLTRDPWAGAEELAGSAEQQGVRLLSLTYGELLSEVEAACADDEGLDAIVQDYRAFLASQELLQTRDWTMVAFPCGDTAADNVETGVYYHPASKNRRQELADIVGIYRRKCITHVGRIACVARCRTERGDLVVEETELRELTDERKRAIQEAIRLGKPLYGDFAEEPHRFYVVERFVEANYRKSTKGGMAGHRYFDLREITEQSIDSSTPIEEIAKLVGRHTF